MSSFSKVNSTYEHALACAYHRIDNRGLLIDNSKLEKTRLLVQEELNDLCLYLSQVWSFPVYIGTENNPKLDKALNLNTPEKVLDRLKDLGYKVPKVRKKQDDGEYEFEESANELALRRLLADPSLWPSSTAGEAIKKLLDVRELITFRNRYINARLYKGQYFCNYNAAGTVTGRRGSKKNIFGMGGNAQNFPARGRLSDYWKQCIISRPTRIFFAVDQMQAEDWPVQSLAQNTDALTDMRAGINRHYKFAAAIFGRGVDALKRDRKSSDAAIRQQAEMEYNLGKRGRHANNYGMQSGRLSEILAGEGYSIPKEMCTHILETINRIDSNVKAVFHKYIQDCLRNDRILRTPLGRERQFFGLRPNDKNYAIFNEAYSYIPQSTVGDNTGMAILHLDGCNDYVVQESHDSVCQEIPDSRDELIRVFRDTKEAFRRTIRFHNGIEVEIPIEGTLGYDWFTKVGINSGPNDFTEENVLKAYDKLQEKVKEQKEKELMNA